MAIEKRDQLLFLFVPLTSETDQNCSIESLNHFRNANKANHMKRFYQNLNFTAIHLEGECSVLSSSVEPVQEVRLEVEVDDYITIDSNNISFD